VIHDGCIFLFLVVVESIEGGGYYYKVATTEEGWMHARRAFLLAVCLCVDIMFTVVVL
jgi:hypothetical protein